MLVLIIYQPREIGEFLHIIHDVDKVAVTNVSDAWSILGNDQI